jgi:hypothetical protein
MGSVLALSAVDRGLEPRSGQTKDYKIGMCCFYAKHAALQRKRKEHKQAQRIPDTKTRVSIQSEEPLKDDSEEQTVHIIPH